MKEIRQNAMFAFLLLLGILAFFTPYVIWGAKYHPLMLDDDGQNVTGVTTLVLYGNAQINGITLWGTKPTTAGHFIRVDAAGTGLEGIPITSSVTGSGGVDAGAYKSIAYYPASAGVAGATVAPLGQAANSILATSAVSLPALTQTLPDAVQQNITKLGTMSQGIAGTTLTVTSEVTAQGRANFESGVSSRGTIEHKGGITAYHLQGNGITGVTGNFTSEVTGAQINATTGVTGPVYTTGVSPLSSATAFSLGGVYQVSYESQKTAGRAGITVMTTFLESPSSSGGTMVVTLENGVTGQQKNFAFLSDGGADIHLKPSNLRAGTSIWFQHAGYGCTLMFDGQKWNVIAKSGVTIQ